MAGRGDLLDAVRAGHGPIASAFPTAGGLYHWASILGSRGWGWLTAWLNLLGLVTVLAAINVGTYLFVMGWMSPNLGMTAENIASYQLLGVGFITGTQALFNHLGIRLTALLTDLSGYLILLISAVLKQMGPWTLGAAYRPIAFSSILGGLVLLYLTVQPPNEKALTFTVISFAVAAVVWFGWERHRFRGPPQSLREIEALPETSPT